MLISVVKKRLLWVVISVVEKRVFWVVISLVKNGSFGWLLAWLKRGSVWWLLGWLRRGSFRSLFFFAIKSFIVVSAYSTRKNNKLTRSKKKINKK